MRFVIATIVFLLSSLTCLAEVIPGDPAVYDREVRDAAMAFSQNAASCSSKPAKERAVCDATALADMQIAMARAKAKLSNTPWEHRTAANVQKLENERLRKVIEANK